MLLFEKGGCGRFLPQKNNETKSNDEKTRIMLGKDKPWNRIYRITI
jgi:hypothetical protein